MYLRYHSFTSTLVTSGVRYTRENRPNPVRKFVMAKTKRIDITDAAVAAIPYSANGDLFYHDRALKGFSLRVGSRTKIFSCRAEHYREGRRAATRRVRLGAVGEIGADTARAKALEVMRRVRATGHADRPDAPERTTMGDIWPRYRAAMEKSASSARTIEDYEDKIRRHLPTWVDRPLREITRDEAHRRHTEISDSAGPFAANGAMRVARALWNFAKDDLELPGLPERNPFRSTRRDSLYAKERARRNGMSSSDLQKWLGQLRTLPALRQALHLWFLLSGMRRRTVTSMRWSDVDWRTSTLTVPAPKGGEPLALPISRPMMLLLRFVRRQNRMLFPPDSPWVWPSPEAASAHVEEIKERKLDRVGHTLRSSYATISEEAGITSIARKALLGHAITRDVTERHYVNRVALQPEFRKAQDKISALIIGTLAPDTRRAANTIGR